jgi:nucleoside-diphosphate-sugar epimerase
VVLRPCAVYGAGDTHNSYGPNRFLRTAIEQKKITLFGAGEEQRDHLFIGDLTQIIRLCLLHRSTGVLNVVSGSSVSFRNVAERVIALLRDDVELVCLPRTSQITHRHFDNTASLRAFPGFEPTSTEEGLRRTVGLNAESGETTDGPS